MLYDLYDSQFSATVPTILLLAFYCAPWADPGSLASPPWVAGLRNKIPACWVENIQIFFCSRQRMSRGVGAVRLKMGLSFRTHSLNPQKHSLGGCEPLGILCEWAHCIHLPHHSFPPPSLSPPRLPPFISRWAYYSPLHACINASLKWGDLRTPFSFHSSERASRVTLTFAELERWPDQSSIDFVSHIYSKYPLLPIRKKQGDVFLYKNGTCKWIWLERQMKDKWIEG